MTVKIAQPCSVQPALNMGATWTRGSNNKNSLKRIDAKKRLFGKSCIQECCSGVMSSADFSGDRHESSSTATRINESKTKMSRPPRKFEGVSH